MGQTLTHGIYLPDEGERNCYSGLAANWQLLDNSVGTIAEHTTQIAGKAPAVHTHTKADITDFPVYGTTAGTICEGNDSRLSDARTPVAHTHTKADVTDLFNSANSWTENNTYAKYILMKNTTVEVGTAPSNNTSKEISFTDKNNETLSRLVGKAEASGNSCIFLHATNKYTNNALDPNGSARHSYFYVGLDATGKAYNKHAANTFPDVNNTYDLGSSSYQWNNLYAKNYYYNGTAWGLDKANTWSGNNTFQGNLYHKSSSSTLVKGTIPSSITYYGSFRHQTYAGEEINLFRGYIGTTGDNCFRWSIAPWVSGSNGRFQMRVSSDGSVRAFEVDGTEVSPFTNNATDLGTSNKKWKSLNGINPGALSLPVTALNNTYDISGNITDLTGGNNAITAARTGWIFVKSDNATEISIENTTTGMGASDHSASATTLMVSIPVTSGETLNIIANCTSIDKAYLLPCQGNV